MENDDVVVVLILTLMCAVMCIVEAGVTAVVGILGSLSESI